MLLPDINPWGHSLDNNYMLQSPAGVFAKSVWLVEKFVVWWYESISDLNIKLNVYEFN